MELERTALFVKLGVLVALLLLGLVKQLMQPERYARVRPYVLTGLIVCLVVGWSGFFVFGQFVRGHFNNYHDLFHYYFGSKYSAEIGYFNLYRCVAVAESEGLKTPRGYLNSEVRNLETYGYLKISTVLERPEICTDRFSPERWEQFKSDIRAYHRTFGIGTLKARIKDMGYNATPMWNMVGSALTNIVPVSKPGFVGLALIDVALIASMLAGVWLAFSLETALIAVTFFVSLYTLHNLNIHGSILRFDWVACVVWAICLTKLNRYKTAGALVAYAAAMRLFPALFVFGFGVKFLHGLLVKRALDRRLLGFFVVFAVVAVGLTGASYAQAGGDYWREFARKMDVHANSLTSTRLGLKYVMMWEGETSRADFKKIAGSFDWNVFLEHKKQVLKDRLPFTAAVAGLFILLTALACLKLEDYEALAFSYPLIFILLAPTIYYTSIIVVLALLAVAKNRDWRYAVSWAAVCGAMILAFVLAVAVDFGWFRHFLISVSILATIALVGAMLIWRDEWSQSIMTRLPSKRGAPPSQLYGEG
ncbi:MAG: hypothetical protein C4523_14610 [Myxococcales bacterium]|nr:MAG: hypothetical protein C4523_14610 [Myxococcales bacterium]